MFNRQGRHASAAMALSLLVVFVGSTGAASAKPKKKPDLTVTSVSGQDAAGGDVMALSHTVKNKGKKKAKASKSKLVLSTDKKAGASDTVLEPGAAIPTLKPKRSFESETVSVLIPTSTPPDSYFVVACADASKKVKGKSETNNCKASSAVEITDVTAPAAPANLATTPGSPSLDSTPIVTGNAEPFATVQIFRNADCSGAPAVTSGTGDNGNFVVSLSVAKEFTTSVSARAVDSSGNASPCSSAITYQQATDESEPNDTSGQADEITEFPAKPQAAISPVDDQDWYAVEVTAGKPTVVAETRGANGAACGTTVETIVELYAPDGTTLVESNDDASGIGACSRIDGRGQNTGARDLAPGTYFLRVRELGNDSTTRYTLTVRTSP